MSGPTYYPRNEVALAAEHRKDQKKRDDDDGGRIPWLYCKPGATMVRVLMPASDDGLFFHELLEHAATKDGVYNPVPCGRPYGIACAFCDEGERLHVEGGESNIEKASNLRPRSQYLWNAICISTPDGKGSPKYGTKILKTGIGIKRDILDLDQNAASGWADITNPANGVTVIVTRTGSGKTGTKYTITPHAQRTSLEDVLAPAGLTFEDLTLYNLKEVVETPTEEDLTHALAETNTQPGFKAAPLTANPVAPTVPAVAPAPASEVQTPLPVPPPPAPVQGE